MHLPLRSLLCPVLMTRRLIKQAHPAVYIAHPAAGGGFGFSTAGAGEVTCCAGRVPIIQAPGVYNEVALKQVDYFMDACAKVRGVAAPSVDGAKGSDT